MSRRGLADGVTRNAPQVIIRHHVPNETDREVVHRVRELWATGLVRRFLASRRIAQRERPS